MSQEVGIVVIGRNEGERLVRCLKSLVLTKCLIVYVDSGSTDGSVERARELGLTVVELDKSGPFSAARARNAGDSELRKAGPHIEFVQFIDGDCELLSEWLPKAAWHLSSNPEVGVVCGDTIEKNPQASIYNMLCDLEWRKEPGEIKACGGIFMVRAKIFREIGGFREDVIAAEDDELCLRIRRTGFTIVKLDERMVLHDAAILQFLQWWKRAKRAGHAFAQGASMHGNCADRHFVRECRRIWFWSAVLPIIAIVPVYWTNGDSLVLLLIYPLLLVKIYRYGRGRRWTSSESVAYALFSTIANFPGLSGMLQFHFRQMLRRRPSLIEYKSATIPVRQF